MKIKELFSKIDQKPVAFIIKGSPDPDSIAGSLALLCYYQTLGGSGKLYYDSYVSHSNNKAMINILGIQMEKVSSFQDINNRYDYYVVIDHATFQVEGLDPAKCILHIDHHKEKDKDESLQTKCAHIIEGDVGASSTIVTRLLNEVDFFQSGHTDVERVTTALMYGIRSDTDNLDGAGPKDWDAMRILAQFASKSDIKKITKSRITAQTAEILKKALANEQEEQGWLYAGVGFLQDSYRDSIATVADELMRRSGIEHVFVYAIIEKSAGNMVVEGSVRSVDPGMDLDAFVKTFSDNAGGRKYKGGFQVPLGFWGTCPNREILSSFVLETIESKFLSILNTSTAKASAKHEKDKP